MKKRIIVVEDFNTSRQIIKKTLENMGHQVDEAADGREALHYFNGSKIDLVISDFNMPNMDGGSLVEYIRSREEYKYIPIFMLSTETSIEKQKRAKEAKITAWIKKPFEVTEFRKLIEKVLV
ncbi:MAG TPA: response regulator [Bacteroidales bacterium]|jgi:two-component system chemotaxis response regulator CheY|nr:response regulator [Bacteroidales bacterium]